MSQRNLGIVLLKVLGVVCVIKAVDFASTSLMLIFAAARDHSLSLEAVRGFLPVLTPLVSSLVLAFVLLRYADVIATRMFSTQPLGVPEEVHATDEWYVLALTVLGVVLLVWYLPVDIGQCLSNFLWPAGDMGGQLRKDMRPYAWRALLRIAMQLGLGLYLVLGSRGIVALVRRLRRE